MAIKYRGSSKIPGIPIHADTSPAYAEVDEFIADTGRLQQAINFDANFTQAEGRIKRFLQTKNREMFLDVKINDKKIDEALKTGSKHVLLDAAFRINQDSLKGVLNDAKLLSQGVSVAMSQGLTEEAERMRGTLKSLFDEYGDLKTIVDGHMVSGLRNILDSASDLSDLGNIAFDVQSLEKAEELTERIFENTENITKELTKQEKKDLWKKLNTFKNKINKNLNGLNVSDMKETLDIISQLKDTVDYGDQIEEIFGNISAIFAGAGETIGILDTVEEFKESADMLRSIKWGFGKQHESEQLIEDQKIIIKQLKQIGKLRYSATAGRDGRFDNGKVDILASDFDDEDLSSRFTIDELQTRITLLEQLRDNINQYAQLIKSNKAHIFDDNIAKDNNFYNKLLRSIRDEQNFVDRMLPQDEDDYSVPSPEELLGQFDERVSGILDRSKISKQLDEDIEWYRNKILQGRYAVEDAIDGLLIDINADKFQSAWKEMSEGLDLPQSIISRYEEFIVNVRSSAMSVESAIDKAKSVINSYLDSRIPDDYYDDLGDLPDVENLRDYSDFIEECTRLTGDLSSAVAKHAKVQREMASIWQSGNLVPTELIDAREQIEQVVSNYFKKDFPEPTLSTDGIIMWLQSAEAAAMPISALVEDVETKFEHAAQIEIEQRKAAAETTRRHTEAIEENLQVKNRVKTLVDTSSQIPQDPNTTRFVHFTRGDFNQSILDNGLRLDNVSLAETVLYMEQYTEAAEDFSKAAEVVKGVAGHHGLDDNAIILDIPNDAIEAYTNTTGRLDAISKNFIKATVDTKNGLYALNDAYDASHDVIEDYAEAIEKAEKAERGVKRRRPGMSHTDSMRAARDQILSSRHELSSETISTRPIEQATKAEEHFAEATENANTQLKKQQDISTMVPSDVINKITQGVDIEKMLTDRGLQGEQLDRGIDLFKDLAGSLYLKDGYPESSDDLFNELFTFVVDNAKTTQQVQKTLGDFREYMKSRQIRIPENMEDTFAEEFVDTWDSLKKLYAIGGNKKKLFTTSKYASTPDVLIEELIANGFGYVFDQGMMKDFNGSSQDALRMLLDAIQRAKDEFKLPKTQTIFGMDDEEQVDWSAKLIEAVNKIEQNVTALHAATTGVSAGNDELAKSAERATPALEEQAASAERAAASMEELQNKMPAGSKETKKNDKQPTDIVQKSVDDALAQLRNATDNKNAFIDLTDVTSVDDLENQVRNMAQSIVGSDLKVDSVIVQDGIARITLYNEQLGVTVSQMWRLTEATEDASKAQLELMSETQKHSPRSAKKYSEAQQKKIDNENRWLIAQLSKLDTLERTYKYSNKKISGETAIDVPDSLGVLEDEYKTVDGLLGYLREQVTDAMDGGLTDGIKNGIANGQRVLENGIKVQQLQQYATTTMKPTELEDARKELGYTLDALESKAKKNNVFSQIVKDFDDLRSRLADPDNENYIKDATGISDFVDSLRVTRSKLGAEISKEQEVKGDEQALKNLFGLQERLYEQRKKLVKLQLDESVADSDIQATERKTQELEQQYEASLMLLKTAEDYNEAKQRELQLDQELQSVMWEQYEAQQDRIAKAEDKKAASETAQEIERFENQQDALAKARMELQKEQIQAQKEEKAGQDALLKVQKEQDKLYEQKKKLVKLQLDESATDSDLRIAERKTEELEEQYELATRLLRTEEDYESIKRRELQLEDELTDFGNEQNIARAKRLEDAEEKENDLATERDKALYEQEQNALAKARRELLKEQSAEQKKQKENQEEILRLQKLYNETDYKWHQADIAGEDKAPYNEQMESYMKRMLELEKVTKLTEEQQLERNKINNEHLVKKNKLLNAISAAGSKSLSELQTFSRWKSDIKNVGMLSDATVERIENMGKAIANITDSTDVVKLAEDFAMLKSDVKYETTQSKATKTRIADIKASLEAEAKELKALYDQLDLGLDLGNTSTGAKQIKEDYDEITESIKKCASVSGEYNQEEIAAIINRASAVKAEMQARKEAENAWWYGGNPPNNGGGGGWNPPEPPEDLIKKYYKTLESTVQQINNLDSKMYSLKLKDGGTGTWAPLIDSLEEQKAELLNKVKNVAQQINQTFNNSFMQGEKVEIPFSTLMNSLNDEFGTSSTIENFFNDIRTQTVLTEQSIDKFIANLQNGQNKAEEFATVLVEKLSGVPKAAKTLSSLYQSGAISAENELYKGGLDRLFAFNQYQATLPQDPTAWSSEQISNIQKMASELSNYVSALDQAVSKESEYFANKKQYANIANIQSYDEMSSGMDKTANRAKESLEKFVAEFTKGRGVITGFTTSAEGISKINFHVLEEGTGYLRNFSAEMGKFTNNVYTVETSLNNMTVGTKAAEKSMESMSQLMSRLNSYGLTVDNNAHVAQLNEQMQFLNAQWQKLGTSKNIGDQNALQNYAADANRLIQALIKLEKAYLNVNDAIKDGDVTSVGKIGQDEDVYKKMLQFAKEISANMPGSTMAVDGFNDKTRELTYTIETADGEAKTFIMTMEKLGGTVTAQFKSVGKVKTGWQELGGAFGGLGKEILKYGATLVGVHDFVRYLRQGFNEVLEIDTAMTELKKVTEETDLAYSNFLKNAYTSSKKIGTTMKDFTQATADFARLGYTIDEASMLAESANVYMNVGDGIENVDDASKSIISTMKAFNVEASDSMSIVDKFNEVGNNFAIDSVGIGEALQRSAAALAESGNSLDESIALITAGNTVIQNPEQVGTALKTLALRLRSTKVELQEAGEDVDGMAESTSKLRDQLYALSKGEVDILNTDGSYKNPTEILREMAKAWKDMEDLDKSAALELMGGKRQANILASIINNFDIVEDVIKTSLNSENSAIEENTKYMDSMQGRIDQLTNSIQSMWVNAMDSDVLKFLVSVADILVQVTDKVGLLNVAFAAFMGKAAYGAKKFGVLNWFNKKGTTPSTITVDKVEAQAQDADTAATARNTAITNENIQAEQRSAQASMESAAADEAEAAAAAKATAGDVAETGASEAEAAAEVASSAGSAAAAGADAAEAVQSIIAKEADAAENAESVKEGVVEAASAAGTTLSAVADGMEVVTSGTTELVGGLAAGTTAFNLFNAAATMGLSLLAGAAISWLWNFANEAYKSAEEIEEAAKKVTDAYQSSQKALVANKKTIDNISGDYAKLASGVDSHGNNISLTTEEYAKYNDIVNQVADMFPQMVSGYTAEGNAILSTKGNVESLTQAYQEQAEAARNAILLGGDDVFSDAKNKLEDAKDQVEAYNVAIAMARGKTVTTAKDQYGTSVVDDAIDILQDYGFSENYNKYASGKHAVTYGLPTKWNNKTQQYENDYTYDEEVTHAERINKLMLGRNEILSQQQAYLGKVNTVLQAYLDDNATYAGMEEKSQSAISSIVSSLDPADFDYDDDKMEAFILSSIITPIYENKDGVQEALNSLLTLDENETSYQMYEGLRTALLEATKNLEPETQEAIKKAFGLEGDSSYETHFNHAKKLLQDEYDDMVSGLTLSELEIAGQLDIPDGTLLTWDELKQKIAEVQNMLGSDTVSVKTYSVLEEEVGKYNDMLTQTAEIVSDNTEVTQEYKDSLLELGISSEELEACFDDNNKLVVKNSKALRDLVKSSNKSIASNVKLAKAQARLQYYELYKEMDKLVDGTEITDEYTLAYIETLYSQMGALEKTIAKYSLLEAKLLGTANAYSKLADAQAADEAADYGSKAEELVGVLASAFKTGELGTEAAQVAFDGLIPEKEIDKSKSLNEQMKQAYNYLKKGPISELFDIKVDKDGSASVEMTKKNVEDFTKSLIGSAESGAVFQGTWEHFDLNPQIKTMKQFADEIGTTEEIAFAYLSALERYDISWLGKDFSTLMDQLMGDDLDYQIQKNTQALAELEYQLATGVIDADTYTKKMYGLEGQLNSGAITQKEYDKELASLNKKLEDGKITAQQYTEAIKGINGAQKETADKVRENATSYVKASQDVENARADVERLTTELNTLRSQGASASEISVKTNELQEATKKLSEALQEKYKLEEPTEMQVQVILEDIESKIAQWESENIELLVDVVPQLHKDEDGRFSIPEELEMALNVDPTGMDKLKEYVDLLNDQHTFEMWVSGDSTEELEKVKTAAEAAQQAIEAIEDPKVNTDEAVTAIKDLKNYITSIKGKTVYINVVTKYSDGGKPTGPRSTPSGYVAERKLTYANGTAHASGTAHKSGSWGVPKTETALVGELGPELIVDPKTSSWHTVGDRGAEFTQVKRGQIVFNHKQTEQLLKNGYITGRGKVHGGAFASGTAYAGINTYNGPSDASSNGGGSSNSSSKLSKAADDLSDATEEFREVFDWIEVRLEEFDEDIGLLGAKLENAIGSIAKNAIVDDMLATNQELYKNLMAASTQYYAQANTLLHKIPAQYHKMIQDGLISIETFVGEVDEKTLEAIQEYREWIQKAADVTQQAEETLTEMSKLAKEAIDNVATDYDNKASIGESKIEQLEAYNSLAETDLGAESAKIYEAIIKENNKNIQILEQKRAQMQAELDQHVWSGAIKKYSQDWYDAVNDISAVDTEIINLTADTENYQDTINELHWEHFEKLISQYEAVADEADNLIDVLGSKDLVDKDTAEWTDEGITALGLYAQKLEVAEMQVSKYAEIISYLNANWKKLGYTETEYLEKLEDLKSGQYDAIKAYNDTKDAIVDLNKERVDAIKEGISKEIDAYQELIDKKKEELDAEKDLYDFQKGISDQQKEISDIERKLAALSADNSASARAKRAQLEADLLEAQAELEEQFYDRSITDQQTALDKELENFQAEKDAEIEKLETYLETTNQVIADSLATVQANTDIVYQTLMTMGEEYNLSVTNSLTSPWTAGTYAVQDFSEKFGLAMSATVDELQKVADKYKEVMAEIEGYGTQAVQNANASSNKYQSVSAKSEVTRVNAEVKPIKVGGKINAGNAQIYDHVGDNSGEKQYYLSDPVYDVLAVAGDWVQVRHHSLKSGITGWFKKNQIKAYAKGSTGVDEDQLALIDELGEELVLSAGPDGRLQYITRGTAIIPHDISENLMKLGQLDPSTVLAQNTPTISAPHVTNNETVISLEYGDILHIDNYTGDRPEELSKLIDKAFDKHMKNLNQQIRRYTRG